LKDYIIPYVVELKRLNERPLRYNLRAETFVRQKTEFFFVKVFSAKFVPEIIKLESFCRRKYRRKL